jgi:hypothetical protein
MGDFVKRDGRVAYGDGVTGKGEVAADGGDGDFHGGAVTFGKTEGSVRGGDGAFAKG